MITPKTPRTLTLTEDTREQLNLTYPNSLTWYEGRWKNSPAFLLKIKIESSKLEAGDICLKGRENGAVIERKGSVKELQQNLMSDDRARFLRALTKLKESCSHPYVLLDIPHAEMMKPSRYVQRPDQVMDEFYRVMCEFEIPVIYGGNAKTEKQRLSLGTQVVRYLWAHAWAERVKGATS